MKRLHTVGLSLAILLAALANFSNLGYWLGEETPSEATPPASAASTEAPLLQAQGYLGLGDEVIEVEEEGEYLVDTYNFIGQAGQQISVDAESPDFDTWIALFNADGELIEENDDVLNDDTNSNIQLTLPYDGYYTVKISSYEPEGKGAYWLTALPH